jgi:AraC-like DNA-binding protein
MAPPRIPIDETELERLAFIGTPVNEIAVLLGCSVDTLERRYAPQIEKARCELRKRLRAKQVELALKGDKTMLIWLGKNCLDQTDEQTLRHAGGVAIDLDTDELEAALRELTTGRGIGQGSSGS